MSGFQSSSDVSKSSANLKHRLENLPLLTKDPELQAKLKYMIKSCQLLNIGAIICILFLLQPRMVKN